MTNMGDFTDERGKSMNRGENEKTIDIPWIREHFPEDENAAKTKDDTLTDTEFITRVLELEGK